MLDTTKKLNCLAPPFAAFLNIAEISQSRCLGWQNNLGFVFA
jgi:hypothetical protein